MILKNKLWNTIPNAYCAFCGLIERTRIGYDGKPFAPIGSNRRMYDLPDDGRVCDWCLGRATHTNIPRHEWGESRYSSYQESTGNGVNFYGIEVQDCANCDVSRRKEEDRFGRGWSNWETADADGNSPKPRCYGGFRIS